MDLALRCDLKIQVYMVVDPQWTEVRPGEGIRPTDNSLGRT